MKIMTILGTRPEIIRLSRVIATLDQHCEHTLVDTGQNFDPRLSDIFYDELQVRKPDFRFDSRAETPMGQIGKILVQSEEVLKKIQPDKVLILGDTNSALSAIPAKRMGIPVYHMEAGNRCYDDRVPEEVNRRIVDHSSDVLLPYTERSRQNLLAEGIPGRRIYVTGNPILEVIEHYKTKIDSSHILKTLGLEKNKFFLVTLHRSENVDVPERLEEALESFKTLSSEYGFPVILSLHPRTRSKLAHPPEFYESHGVRMIEPFGFFDFVHLEKNAFCTLSDSGTVQEECAIFKVPSVTIRDVTERPETLECGSNLLSGINRFSIVRAVKLATNQTKLEKRVPHEYESKNVSSVVTGLLFGR